MNRKQLFRICIVFILLILTTTACSNNKQPEHEPAAVPKQTTASPVATSPAKKETTAATSSVQTESADKWAEGYLDVLQERLDIISEKDPVLYSDLLDAYFHGILHDMDQDGTPELILSYPHWEDSPWLWYYAYSVHSYKDGTIKTIATDITFNATAAAAGQSGFTGIVILDGTPRIVTLRESGETSLGSGTYMSRSSEAIIYPYNSTSAIKKFTIKTDANGIAYYVDGVNVAEDYFESVIYPITHLSFDNTPPEAYFFCNCDTMTAKELEKNLQAMCK